MNSTVSKDGSPHTTDEVFNTVSHLAGAIFSLLGLVILVVQASVKGDPWLIVAFSIYGLSLFLVLISSTLHHGINGSEKVEHLLKLFDYLAIFPLISGTFTPLCLVLLRTPMGWSIFGVIWGLAIVGMIIKCIFPHIPKWVSSTIYISMGWMGFIIALLLFKTIGILGILYLSLGGIFYSIGFIVFNLEKPNPVPGKFGFHEIWHILVILGAFSHFLLMYFIVLPA